MSRIVRTVAYGLLGLAGGTLVAETGIVEAAVHATANTENPVSVMAYEASNLELIGAMAGGAALYGALSYKPNKNPQEQE